MYKLKTKQTNTPEVRLLRFLIFKVFSDILIETFQKFVAFRINNKNFSEVIPGENIETRVQPKYSSLNTLNPNFSLKLNLIKFPTTNFSLPTTT